MLNPLTRRNLLTQTVPALAAAGIAAGYAGIFSATLQRRTLRRRRDVADGNRACRQLS